MLQEPFIEAKEIIVTLKKNGHKAYFVGGAVRDCLLSKDVNDVDITTSATPDQLLHIFPSTIPVGIEHGTVIVRYNQRSYEVTTFRLEAEYEDFRRPSAVTFIDSLHTDLSRRDFTVNAIAMTEEGRLIDPFCGANDVKDKLIRTVGDPRQRFLEDPLRMMRAVRFVSQLSFTLGEEVREAIAAHAFLLKNISIERIAIEFEKLIKGQSVKEALSIMIETEIYRYLPGFENHKDVFNVLIDLDINKLTHPREHWSLLLSFINEEEVEPILRQWKRPSRLMKEVIQILTRSKEINSFTLYQVGFDIGLSIAKVNAVKCKLNVEETEEKVKQIYVSMPIYNRKDLDITSEEVIKGRNQKPGPWVADCFEKMAKVVLEKKVLNKNQDLKRWLREDFK